MVTDILYDAIKLQTYFVRHVAVVLIMKTANKTGNHPITLLFIYI